VIFIAGYFQSKKFKQNYSKAVQGLVIYVRNDHEKDELHIRYIFNSNADQSSHKSFTKLMLLSHALANNENVAIPSKIQSLITKFYGPIHATSYFSIDSIIWKVEVDPIVTRFMALQELKPGDHIQISFNTEHPEIYNVPTMLLMNEEHKKWYHKRSKYNLFIRLCYVGFISTCFFLLLGLIVLAVDIVLVVIVCWLMIKYCIHCSPFKQWIYFIVSDGTIMMKHEYERDKARIEELQSTPEMDI